MIHAGIFLPNVHPDRYWNVLTIWLCLYYGTSLGCGSAIGDLFNFHVVFSKLQIILHSLVRILCFLWVHWSPWGSLNCHFIKTLRLYRRECKGRKKFLPNFKNKKIILNGINYLFLLRLYAKWTKQRNWWNYFWVSLSNNEIVSQLVSEFDIWQGNSRDVNNKAILQWLICTLSIYHKNVMKMFFFRKMLN